MFQAIVRAWGAESQGALPTCVERAVAEILVKENVVAPVDVLVKMALLAPEHLDAWPFGRVPYLERVTAERWPSSSGGPERRRVGWNIVGFGSDVVGSGSDVVGSGSDVAGRDPMPLEVAPSKREVRATTLGGVLAKAGRDPASSGAGQRGWRRIRRRRLAADDDGRASGDVGWRATTLVGG
jgi:hypothetical protein